MSSQAKTDVRTADPYEGANELRAAHEGLLELVDRELEGAPEDGGAGRAVLAHEAEIRTFLARGAATGRYLDEVRDRTACQVLIDYWVSSLTRAGRSTPAARLELFDEAQLPDLEDGRTPYVGLEAFRGSTYFFGREGDTRALVEAVLAAPLVAVLGASGSGKSSLVMGGVLPAIEALDGKPLRVLPTVVPGLSVLGALATAVRRDGGPGPTADDLRLEPGALRAHLAGTPSLIAFDQFEEIFTLATPEDRAALVASLAALLDAGEGHRLLLSIREEFRSRLVELQEFAPYLNHGKAWYSMRPLSYDELREAVERPAAMAGLRFQPGIVDDLVKKVLGQPAALPLLQFTLRALWRSRARNRITWEVYREVGDPLNALQASADRFFDGLAPQTRGEVKRVLLELVRVDELLEAYRRPLPEAELLRAGSAETPEVLALLAENDFVRTGANGVVELKHEALIRNWARLVTWIDEKRVQRRQRLGLTEAAGRWVRAGRPEEGLLSRWQLEQARSAQDLSPEEVAYVEASVAALDKVEAARTAFLREEAARARKLLRRERRLLLATLVALALLAVASSIAFAVLRQRSKEAETRSAEALAQLAVAEERLRQATQKEQVVESEDSRRLKLFTDGLVAAVSLGGRPGQVNLHLASEAQRPRVEQIVATLKAAGVAASVVVETTRSSDVAYYRPADRETAEQLLKLMSTYMPSEQLPARPTLAGAFASQTVAMRAFDLRFAPGTLGDVAAAEARPASAKPRYVIVLSNDADCPTAYDVYAGAARALQRALGAGYRPEALELLQGFAQGRDWLVTAYGVDLGLEDAGALLGRLRGQYGLRADAYVQRRSYYQPQLTCSVAERVIGRLQELAAAYARIRSEGRASPGRTRRLDDLVDEMGAAASLVRLGPDQLAYLRANARDETGRPIEDAARIAALASVLAFPDPAQLDLVLASIAHPAPGSAFEHHQALRALLLLAPKLSPEERATARAALEAAWNRNEAHVREDAPNVALVGRLRGALR